ncbi:MAG: secondary thiamine-phosphate synthase enzyme YjbQ [Chloroflexota bacterium]|nr:secondary thiamine-phosphate synthase enzyme YjbQ [Chloroflexota bacterium]
MLKELIVETSAGDSLVDITAQVKELVAESGVQAGICALIVPHTTAAITLNSGLDPATPADIVSDLKRLVPTRVDFIHQYDTPADAAAHIKATLVGNSITLAIDEGELLVGWSQFILFYEFDGPRKRTVQVKIISG